MPHFCHSRKNNQAIRAQGEMPAIQGKRSISFAGAYLKYGFHEDGFTSGLLAAAALDPTAPAGARSGAVSLPFEIEFAEQEPGEVVLAGFFDWFEGSGWRGLVGVVFGLVLGWARVGVGLMVDLGHLERGGGAKGKAKVA